MIHSKNKAFPFLILSFLYLSSCGGSSSSEIAITVDKLQVASEAKKKDYIEGDLFLREGLTLDASLSDASVENNVSYEVKNEDKPLEAPANGRDSSVYITYKNAHLVYPITVTRKGNVDEYSVASTDVVENSSLKGKSFFFLGSSVTYGEGAEGEAIADFVRKKHQAEVIKEAVSGTTLMKWDDNPKGKSYVTRFEEYLAKEDCLSSLDCFVLQLSTNELRRQDHLGEVTAADVFDDASFDPETSFGAIEHIASLVKQKWDCPILLWSNPNFGNEIYETLVEGAKKIEEKWDSIAFLNLYEDEEFNSISQEQRKLYMKDTTHPTKAGYKIWWLPKFEESFISLLS